MLNFGNSLSGFLDSIFGFVNSFLNGMFGWLTAIINDLSVVFPPL